jgi:hypothetical protein
MTRGVKMSLTFNEPIQYFPIQTSTSTSSMHQHLTEHGKLLHCKTTRTPAELKTNSNIDTHVF